jgi:hypothetical protein
LLYLSQLPSFLTSACSDYEFVVPLYRLFRWMFDSIPIRADRRLGYAVVRGAGDVICIISAIL